MRKDFAPRGGAHGFTLIETVAALLVFSIMTLGIVPLLVSSIKGAGLSRSYTIGKNVALESMERLRDLPYYISYATQDSKVDVLDLYFPSTSGGGYSASGYKYTTECTASSSGPECYPRPPQSYTVTYEAQFVAPAGPANDETYTPQPPSTSPAYRWDSATADSPPSQLLKVSVTSRWSYAGAQRSFRLSSIVGDRRFAVTNRLSGTGLVGYGIQVLTSFGTEGSPHELTVEGGSAESSVESSLATVADQTVLAGRIERVHPDPAVAATVLKGAQSIHHAPPDDLPAGVAACCTQTFSDAAFVPAAKAYLGNTATSGVRVSVGSEAPRAEGSFAYSLAGADPHHLWVTNKITSPPNSYMRLDSTKPVVSVKPYNPGAGEVALSGTTTARTNPNNLVTTAVTRLGRVVVMPTTAGSGIGTTYDPGRPVVIVDDFSASVACDARNSTVALEPNPAASWSATLRYWADTVPGDGNAVGAYVSLPIGFPQPSGVTSTMATVKNLNGGDGPLVYDASDEDGDVYLFSHDAEDNGYLRTWSSLTSPVLTETADGTRVTAAISGAVRIVTNPTDGAMPSSRMTISIGKLSCEAEDGR